MVAHVNVPEVGDTETVGAVVLLPITAEAVAVQPLDVVVPVTV